MNERESFISHEENRDIETDDFAVARRALDAYPRLQASANFDQQVLARVTISRSPIELFCDRLDEIFSRPLLKLFASSVGGILVGLLGLRLFFCLPQDPVHSDLTAITRVPTSHIFTTRDTLLANDLYFELYVRQYDLFEDDWLAHSPSRKISRSSPGISPSSKRRTYYG